MIDLSAFDFTAEPLRGRLLDLAATARNRLPLVEQARRADWCRRNHDNLTGEIDGDDLIVMWGGSPLVTIDEVLLRQLRDDVLVDVDMALAPDLPDDPSSLLDG